MWWLLLRSLGGDDDEFYGARISVLVGFIGFAFWHFWLGFGRSFDALHMVYGFACLVSG